MTEPYQWQHKPPRESGFVCETATGWIASIELPRDDHKGPRRRVRRRAESEQHARELLEELRDELATTGTVAPLRSRARFTRRRIDGGVELRVPGAWVAVSCPNLDAVDVRVLDAVVELLEAVDELEHDMTDVVDLRPKG